jgi:hypothetical protein
MKNCGAAARRFDYRAWREDMVFRFCSSFLSLNPYLASGGASERHLIITRSVIHQFLIYNF